MSEAKEYNWCKKLKDNPTSRVIAVKAMCFHCMGGDEENMPDAGWIEAIRECSAPGCPLYKFRPYKGRRKKMTKPSNSKKKSKGLKK